MAPPVVACPAGQFVVSDGDDHWLLAAANRELEAFSYSVAHDLRAPLRSIDGFSRILLDEHSATLDVEGERVLGVVIRNVKQMGLLIDDLLAFSRVTRATLERRPVDMQRAGEQQHP